MSSLLKIFKCYLHQIAQEIMLFHIFTLHEKSFTERKHKQNVDSACYL